MFNPDRIKLARARRMLTIKALADAAGTTSGEISNYEKGIKDVSTETIEKLSEALNYPEAFFKGADIEKLDSEWVSFRSMKTMAAKKRNAALSFGSIAMLFNDWLEKRFQLPETDLCDLRDLDPEVAAGALREQWGLGEQSVSNMIHLLESKGVRVFSLAEDNKEIDAFSFWKDGKAFVFLNTYKSAERSRFDAAHELGHLVLHKSVGPRGPEAEHEADRFASAFLMPPGSVRAVAGFLPSVGSLIKLKKRWLVSVAALVRRLKDLGIISDWHYKGLNIEISKRGMRKNEPDSIDRESSLILTKIFRSLREVGISKSDVAKELSIPDQEIDQLTFGLAFVGTVVSGTGGASAQKPNKPKPTNKPELRILK